MQRQRQASPKDALQGAYMDRIIEETYVRAVELLKRNSTDKGIKAADTVYNQVWARDSFITFLGANMLEDPVLLKAAKNTLLTLGRAKNELGLIPVNYDLDQQKPRWFLYGAVDAPLWYILGLANLYSVTKDKDLLAEALDHAIEAYKWVRYQDTRNILLIDSQPAAEWRDNTVKTQGLVAYNNLLLLAATKCINRLCDISGKKMDKGVRIEYEALKKRFDEMFAPSQEKMSGGFWPNIGDELERDRITDPPKGKLQYHPNFITFNHVDMHFDALANSMSIILGVSSPEMSRSILSYIKRNRVAHPYPIKVIDPLYAEDDKFFDRPYTDLKPDYWRNDPYCYHNGAVWPFVGGFYVIALKEAGSADFKKELANLAKSNTLTRKDGELGFNEWLHGKTGEPGGQDGQSWNAGMYVAAYMASKGKDPFGFLKKIDQLS